MTHKQTQQKKGNKTMKNINDYNSAATDFEIDEYENVIVCCQCGKNVEIANEIRFESLCNSCKEVE